MVLEVRVVVVLLVALSLVKEDEEILMLNNLNCRQKVVALVEC